VRLIAGVNAERVELSLAPEGIRPIAVANPLLERLECRVVVGWPVKIERFNRLRFASRCDRQNLDPQAPHLHVDAGDQHETRGRDMAAR
jgi:hypothetical protein